MSLEPFPDQRQFRSLLKRAHNILRCRHKIESTLTDSSHDVLHHHRHLEHLGKESAHLLITQQSSLADLLQRVHLLIANRRNPSQNLPSIETIRSELREFQHSKQPLIPAPFPPLCGALPFPQDQIIPTGTFACVPHDGYILAYVIRFNPETNSYVVCDVEPEGNTVVELSIPAKQVLPLPTSSPARRTRATTHPVGSRVLALWPDENGSWTSAFYQAMVLEEPTTSPGLYLLQFDSTGDDSAPYFAEVPEKFIVLAPDEEE